MSERPQLVVLAGPNGAGKSTFFASQLARLGLRFVNADVLARELGMDAYKAASMAGAIRNQLLASRESFVFETVFSDPAGDKVGFIKQAVELGYEVTLCYIALDGPDSSQDRVAMRVTQGGHDVPDDKIEARYPRSLANLWRAIEARIEVRVYDNSRLEAPFRLIATFSQGSRNDDLGPLPSWLSPLPEP